MLCNYWVFPHIGDTGNGSPNTHTSLHISLSNQRREFRMSDETTVTEPHIVLSDTSTPTTFIISAEDKMILYAALQAIANELRRIDRDRANHQASETSSILSGNHDRVSQR
jgi:hypothetical protein